MKELNNFLFYLMGGLVIIFVGLIIGYICLAFISVMRQSWGHGGQWAAICICAGLLLGAVLYWVDM